MKYSLITTHFLVLVSGVVFAAMAFSKSQKPQREESQNFSTKSMRETKSSQRVRQQSTRPRILLEEAMRRPMESHHRRMLINELRTEWAEDDPRGFLESQRNQNDFHVTLSNDDAYHKALWTLAVEDPAWLLAYARRTGDSKAISALASDGDPHVVLSMCLEQGETQWPDGWISELFERGAGIDADFYLQIFKLRAPELRVEAAGAYSKVMFATSRHEAYAAWLKENADELPIESLAWNFGADIAESSLDISAIQTLPEDVQKIAVEGLLRNMGVSEESSYLCDALQNLHRLGLLEGNEDLAATTIGNRYSLSDLNGLFDYETDDVSVTAAEWKEWATRFPADGSSGVIREQALKNWIALNPSAWREIATSVPREQSDQFHARAAVRLLTEEGILAMEQIGDPTLKAQVERYREWELDGGEEKDPFSVNPEPAPWDD